MNINKNNYEEYFIDYYDGNLSAEKVAELFLFLESNSDLKDEFESFSNISLESTKLEFPFKDKLKKDEVNEINFSQYMIGAMEGDLNASEIRMLDEYLKANPSHEKEYRLFRATKLIPSVEVYPDKRELKKTVPMVFNFSNAMKYAVAAILLLAFIGGMYFTFFRSNEKVTNEFANALEKSINKSASQNSNTEIAPEQVESSDPVKPFSEEKSTQLVNRNEKANGITNNSDPKHKIKKEEVPMNHIEALPVATVDGIQIKQIDSDTPEQHLQMNYPVVQSASAAEPVVEQYLSVWEALRQASERKLQKAGSTDGQELASADESVSPRNSVKNIIEKSIEKVSNDKVAINTEGDPSSSTSRFSLALGNFKIEKEKVR